MKEALSLMKQLDKLCPVINMNAVSDLQVAILCLRSAINGAYYNVIINLENMSWNSNLKQKVRFLSSLDLKLKVDLFSFFQIEADVLEIIKEANNLEQQLLSMLMSKRTEV